MSRFSALAALALAVTGLVLRPVERLIEGKQAEVVALVGDIEELQSRVALLNQSGRGFAFPPELGYEDESRDQAGLKLQSAVVDRAQMAGVVPESYGIVASDISVERPTIAVEIDAEAELSAVVGFLASLEHNEPRLAVGSLSIRRAMGGYDQAESAPRVFVQAVIWSYTGTND